MRDSSRAASPSPAGATAPRRERVEPGRSLHHSVRDGCAHAVMLGAGEAYLSPFAIALGAGSAVVGLLASLPLVIGSFAQLASVWALERYHRRKALVVFPASMQAASFAPLFVLPLLFVDAAPALVLTGAIVYFALGHFGNPPWNSWIGELVAPHQRGDYFGRRDRWRTLFQVAALVLGGAVLSVASAAGRPLLGFGLLFATAAFARVVSALEIARMREPPYAVPRRGELESFPRFLRGLPKSDFGRFVAYLACMQGATQFAGPFFALYMLRDLEFTYSQFMAASAVCILAQALAFHNWGRVADQFGNLSVLKFTGFLLPFIPFQWLLSTRFEAILVFQITSGFVWAGFQLSAANFLFDCVPPAQRARSVAHYNFMVNCGILAGAVSGGLIAPFLPRELSAAGFTLPLASNLQALFLLSGGARLLVTLIFVPLLREVREVERSNAWGVFVRVVGIQPIRGLRFSVFNGVHASEIERERTSAARASARNGSSESKEAEESDSGGKPR